MVVPVGQQLPVGPSDVLVPVVMALLVAALLYTVRVPVTRGAVMSLIPWMVVGAGAHALYTLGAFDEWIASFFGPVAVYFTTFVIAGMVWSMMGLASHIGAEERRDAQYVTAAGTGAAIVVGGVVLSGAEGTSVTRITPIFGGMLAAMVVAGGGYLLLNLVYSRATVQTGVLGYFVVFGQAQDALMTAVVVESFGRPAPTSLGRSITSVAADLPMAGTIGTAWLLVVLKIAFALAVVAVVGHALGREAGREHPEPGYLFLGLATAIGLGPGFHQFFTLVVSA